MSAITKETFDKAKKELQITCGLKTLEETIKLNREKLDILQKQLNFVLIPERDDELKKCAVEGVSVAPPMSECAQKLWELNSHVYRTNRVLDEISCNLDL